MNTSFAAKAFLLAFSAALVSASPLPSAEKSLSTRADMPTHMWGEFQFPSEECITDGVYKSHDVMANSTTLDQNSDYILINDTSKFFILYSSSKAITLSGYTDVFHNGSCDTSKPWNIQHSIEPLNALLPADTCLAVSLTPVDKNAPLRIKCVTATATATATGSSPVASFTFTPNP